MSALNAQAHIDDATVKLKDAATGEEAVFNTEDAFLIFCSFCGDAAKTAVALNVRPVDIVRAADSLGWLSKLATIMELNKGATPGSVERGINRSLNFIQAFKFRNFLERIFKRCYGWSDAELDAQFNPETVSKLGSTTKFTTRPLADLAKAMETCHNLLYAALADGATERAKRSADEAPSAVQDVHAAISAAFAKAGNKNPRELLLEAQIVQGEELARTIKKKGITPEDDAHADESGG